MTLLMFALGIITGMYLPRTLAWIFALGDKHHTHAHARNQPTVDRLITEALGPLPRQRTGRHATPVDEDV